VFYGVLMHDRLTFSTYSATWKTQDACNSICCWVFDY